MSFARRVALVALVVVLSGSGAAACSSDDGGSSESADALRSTLTEGEDGATDEQVDCILDALDEAGISDEQLDELAANIDEPPDDEALADTFIDAVGGCVGLDP